MDRKEAIEKINEKLSTYFNALCRKYPPSEIIEFKDALQTLISTAQQIEEAKQKILNEVNYALSIAECPEVKRRLVAIGALVESL